MLSLSTKVWNEYRLEPDARVRLASIAADATRWCDDKQQARAQLKAYRKQIDALAQTLAVECRRSLLVILQGMDASGKDGVIKRVFTGVNPAHCAVTAFKQPDREEREHDYLWRVVRAMPAHGVVGVWNRSHYEDVVARQARGDIGRREAETRLRQIADLERTWVENGTTVRKIFLHISRGEQTKRFKKRLDTPRTHWKLQESDFDDRKHWPRFQRVYEEVFARTATATAPWFIVPADHKWYRDVAVAGIVLAALEQMHPRVPHIHIDRSRFKL